MKRYLSVLLCLVLLFSAVPITAVGEVSPQQAETLFICDGNPETTPLKDRILLTKGSVLSFTFYLGKTAEEARQFKPVRVTSSHPEVASVHVDEWGFCTVDCGQSGTAALTAAAADGRAFQIPVEVTALPECAFYLGQDRTESALLSADLRSFLSVRDRDVYLMHRQGFSADQLHTVLLDVGGAWVSIAGPKDDAPAKQQGVQAQWVCRPGEPSIYDLRIHFYEPADASGEFSVTAYESNIICASLNINGAISKATVFLRTPDAPDNPLERSLMVPVGFDGIYSLYVGDGTPEGTVCLNNASVQVKDPSLLLAEKWDTPSESGEDQWDFTGKRVGETFLLITASDGTSYILPVSVTLPEGWALYTEPERTEFSYLAEDEKTGAISYLDLMDQDIWMIRGDSWQLDYDLLRLFVDDVRIPIAPVGESAAPEKAGVTACWTKRLNDPDCLDLRLHFSRNGRRGSYRIELWEPTYQLASFLVDGSDDKEPGLLFRSGNDPAICGKDLRVKMDAGLISGQFFYWDGKDAAMPLSPDTVTSSNVSVCEITAEGNGSYVLSPNRIGTARIRVRGTNPDGSSYDETMSFEAVYPDLGLYDSQTPTGASYLPEIYLPDVPDQKVWLICRRGFTFEETTDLSLRYTVWRGDDFSASESTDGVISPVGELLDGETARWAERPGEPNIYDLQIDLAPMALGLEDYGEIEVLSYGSAYHTASVYGYSQGRKLRFGDGSFVVGIGRKSPDSDINFWRGGLYNVSGSTLKPSSHEGRGAFIFDNAVYAAEQTPDLLYRPLNNAPLTVNRLWLKCIEGDPDAFLFEAEDGTLVQSIEQPSGTKIPSVHYKKGTKAKVRIYADVTATINGETKTGWVSGEGFDADGTEILYLEKEYQRPDDDTVEKLNQFLQELTAKPGAEPGTELTEIICLGNAVYEGVIRIPAGKAYHSIDFRGAFGAGQRTILKGGIDLNGRVSKISEIHFQAPSVWPEAGEKRAVFGGTANAEHCTFFGYDVALDSSGGARSTGERNLYVRNRVALRYELQNVSFGIAGNHQGSGFIGNGIALQVLQLENELSSQFRISDCNFIANKTDFDMQYPGNYYFYRNYFGGIRRLGIDPDDLLDLEDLFDLEDLDDLFEADSDEEVRVLLIPRKARVKKLPDFERDIAVFTNPRSYYPHYFRWDFGVPLYQIFSIRDENHNIPGVPSYANYLTADWEEKTRIQNSESDQLELAPQAFDCAGQKEAEVVDGSEQTMGVWSFDEPAPAPASGLRSLSRMSGQILGTDVPLQEDFNAGIQKSKLGADVFSVELVDSRVLREKKPVLTLPCKGMTAPKVMLDGDPIECTFTDGKLRFPVSRGGTYLIAEEDALYYGVSEPIFDESAPDHVFVKVSASASIPKAPAAETAILAAYDGSGRLLDVVSAALEGCDAQLMVKKADAEILRVFVLNDSSMPVQRLWESPLKPIHQK